MVAYDAIGLMMKDYLYIALLMILATFGYFYGEQRYEAGVNDEKVVNDVARDRVVSAKVYDLESRLTVAIADKEYWAKEADRLSKLTPEVEYEVVTKIVEVSTCTHRGSEFVELWNEYHRRFEQSRCRPDREGRGDCGEVLQY